MTTNAYADLASEEREFGEFGYKSMRAIHDQTCSCKADGNCQLKVTRDELREQLKRYTKSLETMIGRVWPELRKKFASMSEADARKYGERLGQDHLNRLPRKEMLLWAQMLSTCWGASAEPTDPLPSTAKTDLPHDGSLSKSGTINDMKNGKLDEASGITVFMQSCRNGAPNNPNAAPFCGCLSDYLRVSPPSVIRVLNASSQTGDGSALLALPGVKRCTDWVTGGAHGNNPFVRKGVKPSVDVEAAFLRCRTTMTNGKPTPSGLVFCNRLVASSP